MLHLYTMLVSSTWIPGRHTPGRTILLYNHSYQILLYSYTSSTPFLELLLRQRSHLLKLYTVAVIKSQLKHFAPSSSPPTVPQFYSSPPCQKKREESRLVLHLPLWSQKRSIWAVRHMTWHQGWFLFKVKTSGAHVCQGKIPWTWEPTCHHELPPHHHLFPPAIPQNRKDVI